MKEFEAFYKDQNEAQTLAVDVKTGFNVAEMLSKNAKPFPEYFLKGFSEKIDMDVWDGF